MVREVVDVYGDRQLGRRFRPYPGDGEQASVGLVALEQGGYLRRGGLELGRVFGDPPRQEPHRAVLGGDRGRVRPGRRPHGPDERVHLAAPRARARAAALRRPASATDHGPPRAAMSRSSETSDRSTSDSNSGHDSSRMLRSLFLLLVLSRVRKSLCAARTLAAAIAGSGWGPAAARPGCRARSSR